MTKGKLLNFLLIITSLAGYLEWSGNSHSFIFEAEAEVLSKIFSDPVSVAHPFTVLPLQAQLLLLFTLFQKTPNKLLTYISIGGLGILLLFMFLIGLMSRNCKITLSTIPFLATAIHTIRHYRMQGANE